MKPLLFKIRSGRAASDVPASSDDTLGRGMDIALTLLFFLGVGWALDRWLGTFPAITIGLVVFAAVGSFVRLKYTYDAAMERLEAERRVANAVSSTASNSAANSRGVA